MRAVLTRVKHASVTIDGKVHGQIGEGFLILLGVTHEDTEGRRPEFLSAARPEVAIPLYEKFVQLCRDKGFHTETGEFGAYMQVESLNDGPVTLVVDTDQL